MKTTTTEYRKGFARGRQLLSEPGAAEDVCLVSRVNLRWYLGEMARDAGAGEGFRRGYVAGARGVAGRARKSRWCRRMKRKT